MTRQAKEALMWGIQAAILALGAAVLWLLYLYVWSVIAGVFAVLSAKQLWKVWREGKEDAP